MSVLLAIDPGLSGGLALWGLGATAAYPMPRLQGDFVEWVRDWRSVARVEGFTMECVLEEVSGYAGKSQPGSAMFRFGESYGFIKGVIQALETRDEIGAVFAWLNLRLRFNLHCIIDTAGKSLHGWFDAPQSGVLGSRLKVVLTVFGCDPKLFTFSQPVRVPGALRNGKLQRLVWCREGAR